MSSILVEDLGGVVHWTGPLTVDTMLTLPDGSERSYSNLITLTNGDALGWFDNALKSVEKSGIPGPTQVELAISRLEILPNPSDPALDEPEKYVESPWATTPDITVDPNVWDKAVNEMMPLADLVGTDPYLKRKRVKKHIEAMGQALTPFRSYALIAVKDGRNIIIDGHHRLMASWLLGQETAPVWKVEL